MTNTQRAAHVAGFSFLFLMATVIGSMVLFDGAAGAGVIGSTLESLAEAKAQLRASLLLTMIASVATFVLAATLYVVTCHQNWSLAILALTCRVAEATLYVVPAAATVGLMGLAEGYAGMGAQHAEITHAMADLLLGVRTVGTQMGALLFSVGSCVYFYLFLRARSIPTQLSYLGVLASVILVITIPLQLVGVLDGTIATAAWIPMFVLEISAGLWLLVKGVEMGDAEVVA